MRGVGTRRAMEKVYREYYADPKAVAADLKLTDEMLQIATWPGVTRIKKRQGLRARRTTK